MFPLVDGGESIRVYASGPRLGEEKLICFYANLKRTAFARRGSPCCDENVNFNLNHNVLSIS
jgi:hypothetical protein